MSHPRRPITYDLRIEKKLPIPPIPPGGRLVTMDINPTTQNVVFLIDYGTNKPMGQYGLFLYDQHHILIHQKDITLRNYCDRTIYLLANNFCVLYTRQNSSYLYLFNPDFELVEEWGVGLPRNTCYIYGENFCHFLIDCGVKDDQGNEPITLYRIDPSQDKKIKDVQNFNFLNFDSMQLFQLNNKLEPNEILRLHAFSLADKTILFCLNFKETIFFTFGKIENNSVEIDCINRLDQIKNLAATTDPFIIPFSDQEYLLTWKNNNYKVYTYSFKKNNNSWEAKTESEIQSDESTFFSRSLPPPFFRRDKIIDKITSYELIEFGSIILNSSNPMILGQKINNDKRFIVDDVEKDYVLVASFVKREPVNSLEKKLESDLPALPKPLINIVTSYLHGDLFFSRRSSSPSPTEIHSSLTHSSTSPRPSGK